MRCYSFCKEVCLLSFLYKKYISKKVWKLNAQFKNIVDNNFNLNIAEINTNKRYSAGSVFRHIFLTPGLRQTYQIRWRGYIQILLSIKEICLKCLKESV